jgi:hypothetical protein
MVKAYAVLAAALGMALWSVGAMAGINVGPGFGTACATGGCPLFNGSVNAIGANSLDLYQSTIGPVDLSQLMLILAVPNNPANALTTNPVTGAELHVPGTNSASTPVTVGGLGAETLMTHGEVYGALNLLDGDIVAFNDLQAADYSLFPATYNATTNPIANFSLYEIQLTPTVPFGSNDLINLDVTTLPLGTFALGYGTPSLAVTDTSFAEAGVSGVAVPTVAEPTSLMVLGSALFGLALLALSRPRI